MKPNKKDKEHIAIDDPTQFPHGDMEELAKKAIKKFKSLSWERFGIKLGVIYWYFLVEIKKRRIYSIKPCHIWKKDSQKQQYHFLKK